MVFALSDFYKFNNEILLNKMYFNGEHTYTLPFNSSEYVDYINRNKNKNLVDDKYDKGNMVATLVKSLFQLPKPSNVFANIQSVRDSQKSIASRQAHIKDLKNVPNNFTFSQSNYLYNQLLTGSSFKILDLRLPEIIQEQLAIEFYKYGVNYEYRLYNINDLINTRYYFNYVKIPECYENISKALSVDIKLTINDSLKNGITI
jgi:hypothetical protein